MEPKPGSSEASRDPGAMTSHHSYTDQDFDGQSSAGPVASLLTPTQAIASMPCTWASTWLAATGDVDTITAGIGTMLLLPKTRKTVKTTRTVLVSACLSAHQPRR